MPLPHRSAPRFAQLVSGLFLYGIGISLMVQAALGIAPWDVLTQGIAKQTGWPFGLLTNVIGAAILLPVVAAPAETWARGTVLNVLLIGPSAQFGLWLFPALHSLPVQIVAFAAGMGVLALATGLYIGADFGPGPRDGLMTGLHRRTGWPIWAVRTGIEAAVLLVGSWLGGNAGWGTLAFALLIGPMCAATLRWFAPNVRLPERPALDSPAD